MVIAMYLQGIDDKLIINVIRISKADIVAHTSTYLHITTLYADIITSPTLRNQVEATN